MQVFSDRNTNKDNMPISPLLVVGAVHQHLVANRLRSRAALVVDSGEPREVHHFCTLLAYGADAICPYLAFEALRALQKTNKLDRSKDFSEIEVRSVPRPASSCTQVVSQLRELATKTARSTQSSLQASYIKAFGVGVLKVMAKMGISTLQ